MADSIFHITTRAAWAMAQQQGVYRAPSLEREGFIHFSSRSQVIWVANRRFAGERNLVLLELKSYADYPVKWEDCYDADEAFPHVYAEVCTPDFACALAFEANEDGMFTLPRELWRGHGPHHLAFRTTNMAELSAFYQTVLGMTLVRAAADSHWLAMGQECVLMVEKRASEEPIVNPTDQQLVCWRVSDLRAAERVLLAHGVAIEDRTPHTLYFRDPEGRKLGLSVHPLA